MDDIADDQSTNVVLHSGVDRTSNIDSDGDVDFVKVELIGGRVYQFDMVGQSYDRALSLQDSYLMLMDSANRIVAENDDVGSSLNACSTYVPAASGIYYLQASADLGLCSPDPVPDVVGTVSAFQLLPLVHHDEHGSGWWFSSNHQLIGE